MLVTKKGSDGTSSTSSDSLSFNGSSSVESSFMVMLISVTSTSS